MLCTMSSIILYIATSLDGFIADKDGDVAWLDAFGDADYAYDEFVDSVDCLLMGATTYEQILTFGDWPYKGKKTYVCTHRDLPQLEGETVQFINSLTAESIATVKKAATKDVWLVGGASVAQSLLSLQLVDKMRIFVMPILLNNGIRLFEHVEETNNCTLVESKSYNNGVVLMDYRCS